jgi:hypothetical protein
VVIVAVISAILLPALIKARDKARKVAPAQVEAKSEAEQAVADRKALPPGLSPIIESVELKMELASSYHRLGMDVFTRYRVDCSGRVVFRHPGGKSQEPVLLVIPFPEDTLEARDVQLSLVRAADGKQHPTGDIIFHRKGIYCACFMDNGEPLAADVSFTAFGRERFQYALPPARQLRSVAVTLNLSGVESRSIPDNALQPTSISSKQLSWTLRNLVSDRQIVVLIPGAQAPMARVLILLRLAAVAVLLFGAGFWYLGEQAKPGQLDSFRFGHFLLLAFTYSLFFIIFTVLEFHGELGTFTSMAAAALFSLPLLVLHVSRVLDFKFALTRVVPMAAFTLGLVINGVYGGGIRDYVFVAAAIFVIGYVTVSYEGWAAGREKRRKEREKEYTARRQALIQKLNTGLGAGMADLTAANTRALQYVKSAHREELAAGRSRLEKAREPVKGLKEDYEEIMSRLSVLPARSASWEDAEIFDDIEKDAVGVRDRLEPCLERLQAELASFQESLKSFTPPVRAGEVHCTACGRRVANAPFCQQCGSPRAEVATCTACGDRTVIPVHLLEKRKQAIPFFCSKCGARMNTLSGTSAPEKSGAGQKRDG